MNITIRTLDRLSYCGPFIYHDGRLEQVLFDGGYISVDTVGTLRYHYYQRDHLGSVRAVVDETGALENTNSYSAFGSVTNASAAYALNRYKYNGKEMERTHGIDCLDYGARWYEPVIGRFTTMDPLSEKYYHISPYAYCGNNPVNAIDPDGKRIVIQYRDKDGLYSNYIFCGSFNDITLPDNSFVKDFVMAYCYNIKNGGGENMFKAAHSKAYDIYLLDAMDKGIMQIPSTERFSQNGKQLITWESRRGLLFKNGGRQSAATRLEHEFDHAVDNAINPSAHRERSKKDAGPYDNMEEKRVIQGSETKTAKANKESVRYDHRGEVFDALSPISIK